MNGVCGGDGIADGACDCAGNFYDECGVCDGDGMGDGACDCDGNFYDECGVCGGDGSSCAEVVILSSTVAFPDALTPEQQDDLSDSYCAAIAQESGIAGAAQVLTCTCVQVSARRRLLSVDYLLSATISQNVLTAQNIQAADVTSVLQSVIVQDVINETPSIIDEIGPLSCDSTGSCEPAVVDAVQSTSGSAGGGGGGGTTVVIILLVLLLGAGGAGYYFYAQNKAAKEMDGIATDKDVE